VSSARFNSTRSLAGHGSLCDGSAHDFGVGTNCNGRSGKHIAHQGTVGAHGKTRTENPENIFRLGAVEKYNFTASTRRKSGADIEDKHGVLVSVSVKIDLRHFQEHAQSMIDGRLVDIDSGGERHAPHLGKHGGPSCHCNSRLPGGESIFGAGSAIVHWRKFANKVTSKVASIGCTWIDTKRPADDFTIIGTSTGGRRAGHEGEVLAGTKGDRFFSVTELAVSTFAVGSTKVGEASTGRGRLSEKEERLVSVLTCKETKIADMIPQSHTLARRREMRASFIVLSSSVDDN
jgi:hypothetical protein